MKHLIRYLQDGRKAAEFGRQREQYVKSLNAIGTDLHCYITAPRHLSITTFSGHSPSRHSMSTPYIF